MARGLFATFEGIDGAGKSSAAIATLEHFTESKVYNVQALVEPSHTKLGSMVRERVMSGELANPWTDALLFMADHAENCERVGRYLQLGEAQGGAHLVICDRWSDSTWAYQGAALEAEGFTEQWFNDASQPYELSPDVTFLLDLPVDVALGRVTKRGAVEKFERADFLGRVRERYLQRAANNPERFVVINADRPAAMVHAEILTNLELRMPIVGAWVA